MSLIRTHAIKAVCRRQLWSLLGNPLGYVFVLAFVLIYGGLLFVPSEFFVRNIDDLGEVVLSHDACKSSEQGQVFRVHSIRQVAALFEGHAVFLQQGHGLP